MDCTICKSLCKDCKYFILAKKLMNENLTGLGITILIEEFRNKEIENDKTLL